jgi:hypothetical protein
MQASRLIATLACALSAGAVHAASFDCVTPEFPQMASTGDAVRRVEKQVSAWRKCHAQYRSMQDSVDVERLNDEVNIKLEKWIAATRVNLARQRVSAAGLERLDRERAPQAQRASLSGAGGKK